MQPNVSGDAGGSEGVGNAQAWASFGPPAYVKRGLAVEEAWQVLGNKIRACRQAWSEPLGRLCSQLRHQSGDLAKFRPWLAGEEDLTRLLELDRNLAFTLKYPPAPVLWLWTLQGNLRRLRHLTVDFNQAWSSYLDTVDLGPVNRAREQYNRWYLLEKECAMRSTRLAVGSYRPFPLATREDLVRAFPPLPVFEFRRG